MVIFSGFTRTNAHCLIMLCENTYNLVNKKFSTLNDSTYCYCTGFRVLAIGSYYPRSCIWTRAAQAQVPAATNYDVYASQRKIQDSPSPKCNGASPPPCRSWIHPAKVSDFVTFRAYI
jgi:hypothetical protein